MADFVIRDNSGSVVGRISESSAPGCVGCIGLFVIAAIIWGGISLYQVVQPRIANSKIEAQRISLASHTLDAYTGDYSYARYKIKIERRGDKLFNISDEEFCELVPISTDEFIYARCVNGFQGRARFVRDLRGNMMLIVIHMDGRQEQAPRK